jgi:pSer/pThr/pTyr-binding forkhead associated (FHA) protein
MAVSRDARKPTRATLVVKTTTASAGETVYRFEKSFRIGRADDCEVCIKDEFVSRNHVGVTFENGDWWARDLNSSNGVYIGDQRVQEVAIRNDVVIRLGISGPEVVLDVVQPIIEEQVPLDRAARLSRYAEHYFGKSSDETAGEHTMFIRMAYAQKQTKQKRKYGGIIASLVVFALCVGAYALYEHGEVRRQQSTARALFYAIKSLDLDIANLQESVRASNNQQGLAAIKTFEDRRAALWARTVRDVSQLDGLLQLQRNCRASSKPPYRRYDQSVA